MNNPHKLEKLIGLRRIRMKIAEEASIRQHNLYREASRIVDLAESDILQHGNDRLKREALLYEEMAGGPMARHGLEKYQDALLAMDYQARRLEQSGQDAKERLAREARQKEARTAEHLIRLRQHEKLQIIHEKQLAQSRKHTDIQTELDEEDQHNSCTAALKGHWA